MLAHTRPQYAADNYGKWYYLVLDGKYYLLNNQKHPQLLHYLNQQLLLSRAHLAREQSVVSTGVEGRVTSTSAVFVTNTVVGDKTDGKVAKASAIPVPYLSPLIIPRHRFQGPINSYLVPIDSNTTSLYRPGLDGLTTISIRHYRSQSVTIGYKQV